MLETAARLEQAIHERDTEPPRLPPPLAVPPGAPRALVLIRDDGTELPVTRDRFLIGRGRHCDLVVESTKVSREHAAVVHEGDAWFFEDLGSANGTWHQRARIQRHPVQDGDEFFICAERLRCRIGPA
ncbi:MAG: FHA domain-containing protein [Anaeromyxobacter sp.]